MNQRHPSIVHLAFALITYTAFLGYVSLLPFEFDAVSWTEAIERIHPLDLGTLRYGGRPDFASNVLLAIPLGFGLAAILTPDVGGRAARSLACGVGLQIAILFALSLEIAQGFTTNRVPALNDVAAQSAGATIGALLWLVAGVALSARVSRTWATAGGGSPAAWLYCGGFVLLQLAPLDLTTSVSDLARKYHEGGIEFVPFAAAVARPVDGAWQISRQIALALPIGAAIALATKSGSSLRLLLGSVLLVVAVEACQVLVLSRFASATDAITGAAAAAAGVAIVRRRRPTPLGQDSRGVRSTLRPFWIAAAAAWAGVVAAEHWAPFRFDLDPAQIRERLHAVSWAPFMSLYASRPDDAIFAFLEKFAFAAPLGACVMLAFRSASRRQLLGTVAVAALVLSAIEAGQLLAAGRSPDLTDIIVGVAGAAFGAVLAGPVTRRTMTASAAPRRPVARSRIIAPLSLIWVLGVASTAEAGRITVAWDPSPSPDVAGYVVHYGTASGVYTESIDVGQVTSTVVLGLTNGLTYYFVVQAYSVDLIFSARSAEVSGIPTNVAPSIINPGDMAGRRGSISFAVSASDPDFDRLTFSAVGLPAALAIDPATGLISGDLGAAGAYGVTVTVSDGMAAASTTFTMTFSENNPPTLVNPEDRTNDTDDVIALALDGSDPDVDDVLTYGAAGLPAGLALNTATGVIGGTPANGTGGNHSVAVTVSDGAFIVTQRFIWTVIQLNRPPVVTNPGDQFHFVSENVTVTVQASDADGNTLTFSAVNLPPGLTINATTGVISGTPSAIFSGQVTISVADGSATTTVAIFWDVERVNNPPTLANPGSRTTSEGAAVSLQLTASDPDGDALTFSAGGLPPGLSLNRTTGLIGGSPLYTAAGVYSTTLAVSDGQRSVQVFFTWTISNTNRAPTVAAVGNQSTLEQTGMSLTMTGGDPDGDSLTWSASNLPPGVSIAAGTGAIAGTPSAPGTYVVTVTATDGALASSTAFTWIVESQLPGAAAPGTPVGTITTATPTFSWPAVSRATYYYLSIADGVATTRRWYSSDEAACGGGICAVVSPVALPAGFFTWSVLTWNTYGYGPWSASRDAVVDMTDPALAAPAPTAPAGPISTRTPAFTWNPVAAAIWYEVTVVDSLGVTDTFWVRAADVCGATCAAPLNRALPVGPATWRIRAWSASGAGAWAADIGFEPSESAPGRAMPVSPGAPIASATPAFSWEAVAGTSFYYLRVNDRDGTPVERWYRAVDVGCGGGSGMCRTTPGTTLAAGPASWSVLTWNASGYGPWSETRDFLVEVADVTASAPRVVGPTGTVARARPTFSWEPVAGAVAYRLAVTNNGSPAIAAWFTPAAAGCDGGTSCSAVGGQQLQNGAATWQVQAWTAAGYGQWSEAVDLIVDVPPPAAPVPTAPLDTASSSAPTFFWQASSGATWYYIRVSDVSGPRVEAWVTAVSAGCAASDVCTVSPGLVLASGAATWSVLAWHSGGYSDWASASFAVP